MKRQCALAITAMLVAAPAIAAPAADKPAAKQAPPHWQEPVTGMAFVSLPKGCFKMGAETPQVPQPEIFWDRVGYKKNASEDERPVHEVCVDAFWLGKYEVRASEWQRVMGDAGGSPATETGSGTAAQQGHAPVTHISWMQAAEFAQRLTERSGGKFHFRLPTEAEWEYACRAGAAKDIEPLGEGADALAWHRFARTEPQPVGQLQPNGFGLHDMLGNGREWLADAYAAKGYARAQLFNPQVKDGAQKVLRGGSFRTERVQVRCAMRGHHAPQAGSDAIGLRLVRER